MMYKKKHPKPKILVNQGMRHVLTTTLICNLYLQFRPLRYEIPILTST